MADVIIYTKDYCPYCVKAKALLKSKGQEGNVTEIDITHDEARQFFLGLQNQIKNMNFLPFQSEQYRQAFAAIEKTIKQAEEMS